MVKKLFYNFLLSFCLGVCIQLFLQITFNARTPLSGTKTEVAPSLERTNYEYTYNKWLFEQHGLQSFLIDPDIIHYNPDYKGRIESNFLKEEIPVHCLIFSETFEGSQAIRDTWGSHCNKIRFYSSKINNSSLPILKLKAKSSFDLYCQSIRQVPNNVWIFIAKERTFAVIENLRYYLASKDPKNALYLGHARRFWNIAYNWEDSGIVLSPGTVKVFKSAFKTDEDCRNGGKYWRNGDWYLGKNLLNLNISTQDTRDHLGRGRFNGFPLHRLLFPGGVSLLDNYWKDSLYLSLAGSDCCSPYAITFHGVASNSKMYQTYYLFYRLRSFPAGGRFGNVPPPPPSTLKERETNNRFLTNSERLKDDTKWNWTLH